MLYRDMPGIAHSLALEPQNVQTPRGPIEYVRTGKGPAVLLLHGAMGGWDQGLLLGDMAIGSQGYEFLSVSRPGYLGTPLSIGDSPEEQADACAWVLDSLSVREAAVVAISGGGQCALQFALRYPDRCRRLVMISACSAPIRSRVPFRFHLLCLMARIPGLEDRMRAKMRKDPERAAARSIPDPELRARTLHDPETGPLFQALQESTLSRMAQRLPGTRNDIRQSRAPFSYPLERIGAPLLVIHGTADKAAPFEQGRDLAARVPGAELLAIEGGGHASLFTHRNLIRQRVLGFFGAHLPEEPKPPLPRTESAVWPSSHSTAS